MQPYVLSGCEQLAVTRITVTANESNAVDVLILNEFDHMLKVDWKKNTDVYI